MSTLSPSSTTTTLSRWIKSWPYSTRVCESVLPFLRRFGERVLTFPLVSQLHPSGPLWYRSFMIRDIDLCSQFLKINGSPRRTMYYRTERSSRLENTCDGVSLSFLSCSPRLISRFRRRRLGNGSKHRSLGIGRAGVPTFAMDHRRGRIDED